MKYFDELKRAMTFLGQHPDTIFIGQAVEYAGTAMTNTLVDVPPEKKLEMPVMEDFQMGLSTGLSIAGKIPISIYPRWNFLLLATNQMVNHLDKMAQLGIHGTKVIIRTGIGSQRPLHPHHQHVGDYSDAYAQMLKNIEVIRLDEPEMIFPAYQKALERTDGKSTLIVEVSDFYNEK